MKPKRRMALGAIALVAIMAMAALLVAVDSSHGAYSGQEVNIDLYEDRPADGHIVTIYVGDTLTIDKGRTESRRGGWGGFTTYYTFCQIYDELAGQNYYANYPPWFKTIIKGEKYSGVAATPGEFKVKWSVRQTDSLFPPNNSTDIRNLTIVVVDHVKVILQEWNGDRATKEGRTSVKLNNPAVDKDNNWFSNWNTRPDGRGTPYNVGDLVTTPGTTTLYATWVPEVSVTSDATVRVPKDTLLDYTFRFSDSKATVKLLNDSGLGLVLNEKRLTGTPSKEPGKYPVTVEISLDGNKTEWILTVSIPIYELVPIEQAVTTNTPWSKTLEFLPAKTNFVINPGKVYRTYEGETSTYDSWPAAGLTADGLTVSSSFVNPGTYLIHLTVTAPGTDYDPAPVVLKIYATPEPTTPQPDPTMDGAIAIKDGNEGTYNFLALGVKNAKSVTWTFGDGGVSSGESVIHTYRTPGEFTYTVTLAAFGEGNNFSISKTLFNVVVAEPDTESYIGAKYMATVSIPSSNATFDAGELTFLEYRLLEFGGRHYMFVHGTPNATEWASKTRADPYQVSVKVAGNVYRTWDVYLHGTAETVPSTDFSMVIDGKVVNLIYNGDPNCVIQSNWGDGNSLYERWAANTMTHVYDSEGVYSIALVIRNGDQVVKTRLAAIIKGAPAVAPYIAPIGDVKIKIGNGMDVSVAHLPASATVSIDGPEWASYEAGRITGAPEFAGEYLITVRATQAGETAETTFKVNVEHSLVDEVSDGKLLSGVLAFVVVLIVGALAVIIPDIRLKIATGLIAALLFMMVIL